MVIGRLGLVRGVCDIRKVWFGRRRFELVRGLVRERFGNRETWFG